jgi:hypothetical protein
MEPRPKEYQNIPEVSQSTNDYIKNSYFKYLKGYEYLSQNDLASRVNTGGFIRAIEKNTLTFKWGGKVSNTRDIDSFIRCYNLHDTRYCVLYIRDHYFFYKPPVQRGNNMRKMLEGIIVHITKKN